MKKLVLPLLMLIAPVWLFGCVPVAAVGVTAGALMIVDRRPTDTYLTDEAIEIRAANRINERFGERVHVNVTSFNRMALLTGEAPDEATRAEIEKIVAGVPNVRALTNEIQIAGVSSLSSRSNDAFITSKVKARFVDARRFNAAHVKVITEAGIVYLLGLVTQREADAAVEVARTTAGVRKVVRVFEIISEEEARRLDAQPPRQPPGKPAGGHAPVTPQDV